MIKNIFKVCYWSCFCQNLQSSLLKRNKLFCTARPFYASAFISQSNIVPKNKICEPDMSDFVYPNDQPVVLLDCSKSFFQLTEKEKFYAHYLSRAAWYGGLIVLLQTSCESCSIYSVLLEIFKTKPIAELRRDAISECGFTEEEFTALLVYTCGVFSNMGNYKGMGDTKFIPNLPKEKFEKLAILCKKNCNQDGTIDHVMKYCFDQIYSLNSDEEHLGFPDTGVTTYLSKNITKEDSELVKKFLKEKNIPGYNTRCFKHTDGVFEIRYASVVTSEKDDENTSSIVGSHVMDGHKFITTCGDYYDLLKLTNKNLEKAKEYASKETEVKMLENYIKSFHTGCISFHMAGSRFWIKNIQPVVETYIGFIETYRDPSGIRGEFEGFVAIVNKSMSKKFQDLVNQAEKFLPLLPWPKTYEKDEFLRPDFTSLDVLTFSGSSIPSGICIPNYDEIRQNEGFKNVSLGNVMRANCKGISQNYITRDDEEMLDKYRVALFEVNVGLHELLGHGSGKQFKREKNGTFNFDADNLLHLETNEKITSWYEDGESYDVVFGPLGSSYEECRAECVSLHLSTFPEVLEVFGFKGSEADNIMYGMWFDMCHRGIEGLQMYEPKTSSWLQAHAQARYVILQVCLEAGEDFICIEEITGKNGKPDLLYRMDRSKILTVGKPAIENFLRRLQIYRATADIKMATAMFGKYSSVEAESKYPFLKYRDIVMARKKPRKMFVQYNTSIKDDKVFLQTYEPTHEGLIQSWLDRFKDDKQIIINYLHDQWEKDHKHFHPEML